MQFSDDELKKIIKIVNNEIPYAEYSTGTYREIQIHGEIKLNRDIAAIVLNPIYRATDIEESAREFAKTNNCRFEWAE
jgi:aminoglycoside phosphotransferase family enzyme